MFRWLDARLNEIWVEERRADICPVPRAVPRAVSKQELMTLAIKEAERGYVETLRKELTKLAGDPSVGRFINLPKQKKGVRWTIDRSSQVDFAVADVGHIYALWRAHFGKRRRRAVDGWPAERFAAERWEVSENHVLNRMKKKQTKRSG
jgi:hypothetical protein